MEVISDLKQNHSVLLYSLHIWKLDLNTSNLPVALFQKLEHVSNNCFGLLIVEHPSYFLPKCSIPKPNGYHQWIRVEVLPLESVLQVWKGPFQVHLI